MTEHTHNAGSGTKRKRARAAFVAAGVGALLVSTFGLAEWLSSGTGEGRARAGRAQALTATPAEPTTQLYPGGSADAALVVSNPNPFSVAVRRITRNGSITSDVPDCDAATHVSFTDQTNLDLSVPANGSLDVSLPNAASMTEAAPGTCQGASFTIPVAINAASGPTPTPTPSSGELDTDEDGVSDGLEAERGTDPNDVDTDGDRVTDLNEFNFSADPLDADTDDDGLGDQEDIFEHFSPSSFFEPGAASAPDLDNDGIPDGVEAGRTELIPGGTNENGYSFDGTDPARFVPDADPSTRTFRDIEDTDNDGVPDGTEDANHNGRVDTGETDPNDASSF